MQQAYINAFTHLHQFEERAQFSTWLIRIALNEAFGRRRKIKGLNQWRGSGSSWMTIAESSWTHSSHRKRIPSVRPTPQELHRVLEAAVDSLPDNYRTVFMLRDIEGLSTSETGEGLGLGDEAVKTRLHRARAMIRRAVTERIGGAAAEAFQFHAPRCDRVVTAVLARIAQCP